MFGRLRNIFRQLAHPSIEGGDGGGSVHLSIEGIAPAPLTAEPDDAELAAAALLASMAAKKNLNTQSIQKAAPAKGTAAYYRQLSERIRETHAAERRAAMRFVAFAESELDNSKFKIQNSKLAELERGLFKWQDAVEREQGDLLKRWQHCLADVTVRQMSEIKN